MVVVGWWRGRNVHCTVLVMQYGSKICFEIEIYEELNFKIMTFNLHFVLSWYSNNLLLESVSYCPSGHAMTTDNLLYCILSYVVSLFTQKKLFAPTVHYINKMKKVAE